MDNEQNVTEKLDDFEFDFNFNLNEVNPVDEEKVTDKRVFDLAKAMLNTKQFDQLKTDYKKIKQILVKMHIQLNEMD